MAFRIEAGIGAAVMALVAAPAFCAETARVAVRHVHGHGGANGTLEAGADGIVYREEGGKAEHGRTWRYGDIEQLTLTPEAVTVVTYEDRKWELGRDREYVYRLKEDGAARKLYAVLGARMDGRLVAWVAEGDGKPVWRTGAKMLRGWAGVQGELEIGAERIVFRSGAKDGSRTWRRRDIENISREGPRGLAITSGEKSARLHAGPREYRFQLKREMSEEEYNEVWRAMEGGKGLEVLGGE